MALIGGIIFFAFFATMSSFKTVSKCYYFSRISKVTWHLGTDCSDFLLVLLCLALFSCCTQAHHSYRERKCAETTDTVLVPLAAHFQC